MRSIFFLLTLIISGGAIMSAQGVELIVHCPEHVKIQDSFVCDIYFKNESSNTVIVPNYLLGGLDRFFSHRLFDPNGKEIFIKFVPEYAMSRFAMMDIKTELTPGGIVGVSDGLLAKSFFPSAGRFRIQFIWEGSLSTKGGEKATKRFVVDKWVTVE